MTDTHAGSLRSNTAGVEAKSYADRTTRATGWVGWIVFAAIMMIVIGALQVIQGLVALFNSDYYLVGASGLVVDVDYTAWGWGHLIVGALAVLIGFGVLTGNVVAQVAAIAIAVVSVIFNIAFIAAYPWWSMIVIALDVLVIYALAVHGREMRA